MEEKRETTSFALKKFFTKLDSRRKAKNSVIRNIKRNEKRA